MDGCDRTPPGLPTQGPRAWAAREHNRDDGPAARPDSAEESGDDVLITVADSGPGVPDNALEKILEPFYRIEDSRDRKTGGSGLGLAIVRSCIEACGGSVECRNRKPKGLAVILRLPAAPHRGS